MLLVSLPRSERVPPLIFRLTTGGRRLRSAALLSALARGSATKVNSSGRAFHSLAQHPHGRIAAQVRLWTITAGSVGCSTRRVRRTVSGRLEITGLSMVVHLTHRVGPPG